MKKYLFFFTAIVTVALSIDSSAQAQQYKLKQSTSMMGMKTESTIYVKGMRKRTETAGMMGMGTAPITIEQCDLQRNIKINDKKKLYYIEPFAKEEIIDEEAKPVAAKAKPATNQPKEKVTPQTGGVINMYYIITDTGERKKISGFTARHVWTTQKIKPSPDACTMKDSMIIKTNGWYIDLPQFNCPVRYTISTPTRPTEKTQQECKDQYVSRRSGKGKLGFALTETRTIIIGNGQAKTSEFETSLETVEFSTTKLDSMLFEIPLGYTLAANEDELQEKFNMGEMMKQAKENNIADKLINKKQKPEGTIRIGVYEPKTDGQVQTLDLQQYLAGILIGNKVDAVTISSADDAKKYNCDYSLTTEFVKIKQANKVGGLLKAIKNADPNAVSSFNIEVTFTLIKAADGLTKFEKKLNGKYDGKIDDAARKALDEASSQIIKALQ